MGSSEYCTTFFPFLSIFTCLFLFFVVKNDSTLRSYVVFLLLLLMDVILVMCLQYYCQHDLSVVVEFGKTKSCGLPCLLLLHVCGGHPADASIIHRSDHHPPPRRLTTSHQHEPVLIPPNYQPPSDVLCDIWGYKGINI